MPASGVSLEMYRRMSKSKIPGVTVIGFGGKHYNNISTLITNESKGKVFLMPSLPPVLSVQSVRIPKFDFSVNPSGISHKGALCIGCIIA